MMDLVTWNSSDTDVAGTLCKKEPVFENVNVKESPRRIIQMPSTAAFCHKQIQSRGGKNELCDEQCQLLFQKLKHNREILWHEKQALQLAKESLSAERKTLELERESVQAEKQIVAIEKEVILAERHLLKVERDALKAERTALEVTRKEVEADKLVLKSQISVLKLERCALESEKASLEFKKVINVKHMCNSNDISGVTDDLDDDGNEERADEVNNMCVQFGESSGSPAKGDGGDGDEYEEKIAKEESDCFQCDVCSKMYQSQKSFYRHLKIHSTLFHCGACQKPFESQDELDKHKEEHSRAKLICPICGDALVSKYSLEKHRRMKHAKEELLACSFQGCTKRFFNEQLLGDHMNVHAQRKPYQCLKCGRQYASALALIAHKKGCGNPDAHVCDICGVRMSARSTLAEHKRRRHTDERYTCPCGQRYAWRSGIIRHKKKCPAAIADQLSVF